MSASRSRDAQHDDRDLGPAPQALDHLEAVDAREAEVEDDHVGLLVGSRLEGFLSGGGEVDLVAASTKVIFGSVEELMAGIRE